ncbi:MAG: biotin-dependent carboxyltransferase family protein, partial [Vicinamibacteria bacterium]
FGHRRLGVAPAGPMDAPAHRAANALVGNGIGAATLECTLTGPTLRFLAPTMVAVTGADLGAILRRSDLGDWEVPRGRRFLARAGSVLAFRGRRTGCRAYLAFGGGIDVPPVLGSRSTDLVGGFGGHAGRPLRAGDVLALGRAPAVAATEACPLPSFDSPATVRVLLGPQDDHFEAESLERLLGTEYAVTSLSDRVGCRLSGAPLRHVGRPEIVTDGMICGSIEVPPEGQPIVMMADAPTTGGYPKVATVVTADLPRVAQLVPGEGRVRFRPVDP